MLQGTASSIAAIGFRNLPVTIQRLSGRTWVYAGIARTNSLGKYIWLTPRLVARTSYRAVCSPSGWSTMRSAGKSVGVY